MTKILLCSGLLLMWAFLVAFALAVVPGVPGWAWLFGFCFVAYWAKRRRDGGDRPEGVAGAPTLRKVGF